MNKNKKLLLLFLAVIIVLVVVIVFIASQRGEKKLLNFNNISQNNPISEMRFEEKEDIIKSLLSKKYQNSADLEVLIARESEEHINGLFFINNYNGQDVFRGKFFAVINKDISIVWSGEGPIDCSVLNSYSFPQEMAPECF